MNKFDYVTGYLPYVATRETQATKTRTRIIYFVAFSALVLFLLPFIASNNTIASSNPSSMAIDPEIKPAKKPIWLAMNSMGENKFDGKADNVNQTHQQMLNNKTPEQTATYYDEDLERLLNKAFDN